MKKETKEKEVQVTMFRGRDKNRRWHFGDLRQGRNGKRWIVDFAWDQPKEYQVSPLTVSRFTGLKDAEKKAIYEGDVIRIGKEGRSYDPEANLWLDNRFFLVPYGICRTKLNMAGKRYAYVGFRFDQLIFDEEGKYAKLETEMGWRNDPLYWVDTEDCYIVGNRWDMRIVIEGERVKKK